MDAPWLSANVVQRMNELLRADACRAKFADHDAGRCVGEHGSIGERRPACNRQCKNAENGVPCTGNVKDLPASCAALDPRLPHARIRHFKTRCWDVSTPLRSFLKNVHSFWSPRDHQRAAPEASKERPTGVLKGVLIGSRVGNEEYCFHHVAHDGPRSAIRVE